ncbi:MAG: dockerin type I domain-containing protein, partial [Patescibacteria group bacterium]
GRNPYTISWKSQGAGGSTVSIELKKNVENLQCGDICDVNGDGRIDTVDQQLILEFKKHDFNNDNRIDRIDQNILNDIFMNGTCPADKTCDLNGDGNISQADIQLEHDYVVSLYDVNGDGDINDLDQITL